MEHVKRNAWVLLNLAMASGVFCLFPRTPVRAQPAYDNLFLYRDVSTRSYFGFEGGAIYSWLPSSQNFFLPHVFSTGNYALLDLDNAGAGIGFTGGLALDLSLAHFLGIRSTISYISNRFSETESDHQISVKNGGDARLTNHWSGTLNSIQGDILLRAQLLRNSLFCLGGFGISKLLNYSAEGYQRLDSPYVFNGTQDRLAELPSSTFDSTFSATRTFLKCGIGTYIPLGEGAVLTPELLLSIPLTHLFTSAADDSLNTWRKPAVNPQLSTVTFNLGLRIPLSTSRSPIMEVDPTYANDCTDAPMSEHDMNLVEQYWTQAQDAIRQQRFDDAIQRYEVAITVLPCIPDLHRELAYLLAERGKYSEAANQAFQYLSIDPHDGNTIYMRENGYIWGGRKDNASKMELPQPNYPTEPSTTNYRPIILVSVWAAILLLLLL
jgi:tetratricopeptide (TPR) repeat protein